MRDEGGDDPAPDVHGHREWRLGLKPMPGWFPRAARTAVADARRARRYAADQLPDPAEPPDDDEPADPEA